MASAGHGLLAACALALIASATVARAAGGASKCSACRAVAVSCAACRRWRCSGPLPARSQPSRTLPARPHTNASVMPSAAESPLPRALASTHAPPHPAPPPAAGRAGGAAGRRGAAQPPGHAAPPGQARQAVRARHRLQVSPGAPSVGVCIGSAVPVRCRMARRPQVAGSGRCVSCAARGAAGAAAPPHSCMPAGRPTGTPSPARRMAGSHTQDERAAGDPPARGPVRRPGRQVPAGARAGWAALRGLQLWAGLGWAGLAAVCSGGSSLWGALLPRLAACTSQSSRPAAHALIDAHACCVALPMPAGGRPRWRRRRRAALGPHRCAAWGALLAVQRAHAWCGWPLARLVLHQQAWRGRASLADCPAHHMRMQNRSLAARRTGLHPPSSASSSGASWRRTAPT